MKRPWIAAGLLAGLGMAQAVQYQTVVAEKSQVTFHYKQMGVAMDGKFKKFSSQLVFDPAKPIAAQAKIDIDLASIDTGSSEADDEVVGKSWFHVKAFPKATFVAQQIKSTVHNQYDVTGQLMVKGKTQDIKFPLKYAVQGTVGVFTGGFTLRRSDFNIGEGIWSKFDVIANDIQVNFQLAAVTGK